MKVYKRIFSIFLALALVLPLLPGELAAPLMMRASAAEEITSGSAFAAIRDNPGGSFRQKGDITLTSGQMLSDVAFTGSYDGDGYTITVINSNYRTAALSVGGVFGSVSGTVENLNVKVNLNVESTVNAEPAFYLGGVAGTVTSGGLIKNCGVSGELSLNQDFEYYNVIGKTTLMMSGSVGGVAGYCAGGQIIGCYSSVSTSHKTGEVSSRNQISTGTYYYHYVAEAGGIAGRMMRGTVKDCLVEKSVITAGNSICNNYTYSFVGSVIGREFGSGSLTVQNNAVRSTKLYANYQSGKGYGYAGALAGGMGTFDSSGLMPNTVGNNYLDCYVGSAAYGRTTGAVNFNRAGNSASGYQAVSSEPGWKNTDGVWVMYGWTPVATPDRLGSQWVNDVVDRDGDLLTTTDPWSNIYPAAFPKWITTDAPEVSTLTEGAAVGGATSVEFTITAPNKIAPADGSEAWDYSGICYEMTFYDENNNPQTVGPGGSALHTEVKSGKDLTITIGKVAEKSTITIKTYMKVVTGSTDPEDDLLFPRVKAHYKPLGGIPDPPVISPGADGALANGITINGSGGTIYWTITKTGGTAAGVTGPTEYSGLIDYNTHLDGDWRTLTVTSFVKSGNNESEAATVTYSYTAKPQETAPVIEINNESIKDQYYTSGTSVEISHSKAGTIRYTTNGTPPGRNVGEAYNDATGYPLPQDRNSVTISAVLVRDNYPDSLAATETIKIKAPHGSPLFSIENNTSIPSGKPLSILIPENDLPAVLRPAFYMKEGDSKQYTYEEVKNAPDNYYGVIEVVDGYVNGERFSKYSDYQNSIPYVTYQFGSTGNEKTYTPSTPEIRYYYSTSTGERQHIETVAPVLRTITLTGTAGSTVDISAELIARYKEAYEDSAYPATAQYTFFTAVATPKAMPTTSEGSITKVNPGSTVSLSCATAPTSGREVFIFYSLTGTPSVSYNSTTGQYTANAGTSLYNTTRGITVSGTPGSYFTIYAGAVKSDMSPSGIGIFTYQLPSSVQSVYATPVEGTVVKGTEVTLSTTTSGATIFYETATSSSKLDDPIPYESPTYTKPIKIEGRTYISAVAVKDGVESAVTEYEFKVANQVGEPEPSIPSGSVVAKGTKLILASDTSGASVTYTKDGSDPTDETNTKRMYGSEIAIDAEEGKSVSISAYAHKTGMTPSEVVSVSYTVSKSGEVMTANPVADSTVKPGDRITLSTSVTGAEIHYTTDGSEPTRDSEKGSTVTVDGAYGETFIIRAVAATETTITTPYVFSYKVVARTPSPSASIPNGAVILEGATVALTASEGDIYYTTDGNEPASSGQLYTEPFKLTGSAVLKAIAIAEGKASSTVVEYIYTMAGQVAAPTSHLPSGTIDVGSKVELSTTTEGATIYYTTNGETPSVDNLRDCFTYEGPIAVSRPVSIRMFAVKEGMNASVVNTVTYTVAYPAEEEETETDPVTTGWNSDRLFLFDQFVDSGEGPQFEDVVLRDAQTLTVVSAAEGALPDGVQLMVVREKSPSAEDEDAVMRSLEMKLGVLYNISLVDNSGAEVQPLTNDGVEVGIPIPEGFEDTIVLICRINDNGTVTAFPTRRSAGMLYAVVDHFSKYAVAVPALSEEKTSWRESWHLWLLSAGAVTTAATLAVAIIKKRRKAEASQ